MANIIQAIIERGRAFGIQNSEQYALIWYPIFRRPLSAKVVNGKYFGGNRSSTRKRRANG